MDLFDKCHSFTEAHQAQAAGVYPFFVPFAGNCGATARVGGREIVMAGSNCYLGLTSDPRVVAAAHSALDAYGSSCTGSRLLNGNLVLHEQLEAELAAYLGKPAALVFSTGYGANLGVISALVSRGDELYLDREAHASAIDGGAMTRAPIRLFGHNSAADLRHLLTKGAPGAGRLVVVDGVYSMGGDICSLPEILDICEEFDARILVDDAHGLGVTGEARGTCAQFGVTDRVDLITLTFSKALASIGGAVVAEAEVIHYLRHHARAQIFSASMTPASAAAALAALRIAVAEPWRARRALANARYIVHALRHLGLHVGATDSPIVPVHTTGAFETAIAWRRLMDLGVYTNAVMPPAASARLRLSFMATHTTEHLDGVVNAFRVTRDEGLLPTVDDVAA